MVSPRPAQADARQRIPSDRPANTGPASRHAAPDDRPRGRDRACGVVDDDGGIRIRPSILQDARDHVLYSLPPSVDADEAEESIPMVWLRTTSTVSRVVGCSIEPALAGVTLSCMLGSAHAWSMRSIRCPMRSFDSTTAMACRRAGRTDRGH